LAKRKAAARASFATNRHSEWLECIANDSQFNICAQLKI